MENKSMFLPNKFLWPFFSRIQHVPSLNNLVISNWCYFGVYSSNSYWGKFEKYFEYSKLFLQLQKSCKLFNGLDDFKVALNVCPNHRDNDIHSDHSYLDILGIPWNSTLIGYPKIKAAGKLFQRLYLHLWHH